MNRIKFCLIFILTLFSFTLIAQEKGVYGKIVNRVTKEVVDGAKITLYLSSGNQIYKSSDKGEFKITDVPEGMYRATVEADAYQTTNINIKFENYLKDLGSISITPELSTGNLNDGLFIEFDSENEAGVEDIPSVLSSSKDIYDNVAGYKFSQMRHKSRGLDGSASDVYINGIRFNDALNGYTPWSLFSGLNEVTREKEIIAGMEASDFGIGGVNGITNINAYASRVKKGFRSSVLTNSGQYRFRLMLTYSSGKLDNGWSYSVSASTRLGGNDWIKGVYYQSFAYYAGAEKRFGDKHRLALSVFASPSQRGAQMGTTQEAYDLMGSNFYNPNWGYQNGDVRNARVRNTHEPVAILNYIFTPYDDLKLSVGLSYRMGRNGYSALDWYDAPDPRPDYYRNLPSYYDNDPEKAAWVKEGWMTDPNVSHVNWNRLYDVNTHSYFTEGPNYSQEIDFSAANRSKYVIEERHTDQNDINANIQVVKSFKKFVKLSGGFNYRWNQTEYYKKIKDLLGGDYWLDVDQFAERDFGANPDLIQNDLNNPNRLVKEGDKYGYDYNAHIRDYRLWANADFNYKGLEANIALEGGYNQFWREGLFKKGLFPENSFGNSDKHNFWTYTAKLGLAYQFNANHRVYANAGYMSSAPYFQEAFLSPRTRNSIVPNLSTKKTFSADLNYSFKLGEFAVRATAFYTSIKDQTDLISFYDDLQRAFTNFAMSGIDQRNIGMELGFRVPLPFVNGLSVQGAVSYGNYVYTSNPFVTQTVDNSDKVVVDNAKVYWEGYKVASTPQLAADLGLNYRGPNYIFAGIDLGFYDQNYISMNPLRRTDFAMKGIDSDTEEGLLLLQNMTVQEEFPHAFILSANFGKSWYIQRKYNLGVSLDVKNILNNRNIRTGGYEQMRLSSNKDASGNVINYSPFDSKYFYLFGINYMVNVYFRF